MNKTIKPLIFSDMDGTLYSKTFKVMEETKKDIEFAITPSSENHNPADFCLATGNPFFERVRNVADDLKARFVIAESGALIYDNVAKKIVLEKYIDDEIVQKVINYSQKTHRCCIFFNSEKYYYLNADDETIMWMKRYHFDTEQGEKIMEQWNGQELINISKFEFWATQDQNVTAAKELKEITPNISYTGGTVEVLPKNTSKGLAIEWIINNFYPEHKLEDVMCAGDSGNDISMFEKCGYSYAMANSSKKLKLIARYHTSSVEQNGLGEAIIDYLYRFDNIIKKFLLH